MATQKIKVLGDAIRVFNKYDDYRRPVHEFGYSDYAKGDTVEVPDWVATRLLKLGTQNPNGAYQPVAIPADKDEDEFVVEGYREDVSPNPEYDFGTTTVGGTLVSDPKGELAGQRAEARKMELTPERAKSSSRPAHQNKSEG